MATSQELINLADWGCLLHRHQQHGLHKTTWSALDVKIKEIEPFWPRVGRQDTLFANKYSNRKLAYEKKSENIT